MKIEDPIIEYTQKSDLDGQHTQNLPIESPTCNNIKVNNKGIGKTKHQSSDTINLSSSKICHVCNVEYKNLHIHLEDHHSDITRPFECFICHKSYKKMFTLKQHMVFHSTRNCSCPICGKTYFNKSDLRIHCVTAHTTGEHYIELYFLVCK